ncbi:putative metal-nicotianamine transporter YSL12 [Canna indica]|uniref:Metal-nicotianamine transporter YSL12 n=1 Tax=Canna indica TaxID=4628 RepID=A0AAQ3QDM5_9LILI|nr:putative metal-nicotianamine transporter YSL12 [Canna indica]
MSAEDRRGVDRAGHMAAAAMEVEMKLDEKDEGGATWRRRGKEDEEEEVVGSAEETSIEREFEGKRVPPWQEQLTLRAFVVSLLLGVLFSVIVMKLNLTTGVIPSLNVSAGLLGFFFVRTWTAALSRAGLLHQPFTRQENTVIQTCIVATSSIAFSGNPFPTNCSCFSRLSIN